MIINYYNKIGVMKDSLVKNKETVKENKKR